MPSSRQISKCSRVCGITDSSAATTSSTASMPPAPASMFRTNRSWPGTSTNATCDVADGRVREPEVDRDAARLFFLQPIGIGAGQRLDERALAVIDVAGRADDERSHGSAGSPLPRACAPAPWPSPATAARGDPARGGLAFGSRARSRLGCARRRGRAPLVRTASRISASPRSICRRSMIDADHLHAHAVAEPVDASVLLAAQHVRALDEPVVVVGHRRDVHHAFDEVLDELDEQAEGADAGDVALELVADLVGHEPDFLPLHQLALGVVGAALALGRVPRDLRQILGQLRAALLAHAVPRLAQRAVDDEVRIPADRRREVRVALRPPGRSGRGSPAS